MGPSGSALATIDLQRDFALPEGSCYVTGTAEILPAARRLAAAFRAAGLPVFHVIRLYAPDGSDAEACRRDMLRSGRSLARPGTAGARLVEGLAAAEVDPDPGLLRAGGLQRVGAREWLVYKPRWGAFFRTPLEEALRREGVGHLVFCGCNFPNCPRASIYQASERDFAVTLAADAVSGLYARGRRELAGIGVELAAAGTVIRRLGRGAGPGEGTRPAVARGASDRDRGVPEALKHKVPAAPAPAPAAKRDSAHGH